VKATARTGPAGPAQLATCSPEATCQITMVPLAPPQASRPPGGSNATAVTAPVRPASGGPAGVAVTIPSGPMRRPPLALCAPPRPYVPAGGATSGRRRQGRVR
jgi:hypothetical protein